MCEGLEAEIDETIEATAGLGGGRDRRGRHREDEERFRLVNRKDKGIARLNNGCSMDELKHWQRCMELHLECQPGWKGATLVMRQIRKEKEELCQDNFTMMINQMNRAEDASLHVEAKDWSYEEMEVHLYALLVPLLSSDLLAIADQVRNMDGFEMWRQVVREKDPVQQNAAFHLESEIQSMAKEKCRNLKSG